MSATQTQKDSDSKYLWCLSQMQLKVKYTTTKKENGSRIFYFNIIITTIYFKGIKRELFVAPIPGRPWRTGL